MSTHEEPADRPRRPLRFRLYPQFRYPLLVVAYLLVAGAIFAAAGDAMQPASGRLEIFTAQSVQAFMQLFSSSVTTRENLVTFDGFSVGIIIECAGILEMLIYSACVLAFPAPWRARLVGIPLGCLAIYAFNVVRIVTLLIVGRHFTESLDFFHIYFWQATLIAMIVGVLYGWIRIFVRP